MAARLGANVNAAVCRNPSSFPGKMKDNLLNKASLSLFILLSSVCGTFVYPQADRQLVREGAGASQPEKRLALVIGNGRYTKASPLDNPVNDANDMAAALGKLGFEVIKGTDTNLVQMRRLIREFGERLDRQKGVGLFYFAGHGVEVRGRNYLIPVDADIAREIETEDYAIDVNSVLRQMEAANNGFNVMILDACRNNPFSRGWNRSGETGGLANVNAPTGTYIAFAAAPGSTASDGRGTRNGIFTGALLKQLQWPNLKLEEVFKRTREEVMTVTGNKQVPWDSSSIKGDFYFRLDSAAVVTKTNPIPAGDAQVEQEYWDAVKNSTRAADFEGYLREYPNGRFAAVARVKIRQLGGKTETPAADALAKEVGRYNLANGQSIEIFLENGRLTAFITGQPKYPLENVGPRKYKLGGLPDGISGFITFRDDSLLLEQTQGPNLTFAKSNAPATSSESANGNVVPGTVRKNSIGMELVWVPPGEFMMGSENSGGMSEPVRRVTFRDGFWIGKYEVTQGQWESVMGSNPSYFKKCGLECPVEQISWDDAKAFVARLNTRNDGWVYALPSEAEWEYAARAGTTGDAYGNFDDIAWYEGNSRKRTWPVGKKQPNVFGLYDVLGNVMEWVEDCIEYYDELATDGSANTTRSKTGDTNSRVLRGGSVVTDQVRTTATYRDSMGSVARYYYIGIRVVARPR